MHDSPPVAFRPTPEGVFLVGTAGGPLGGDDVRLGVEVTPDGELDLRSAAATVALAGCGSSWEVTLDAGARSRVRWRPEPLIVTARARHLQRATVRLASDALLDWTEVTLLGRHGEACGDADVRLEVDAGGRPLLRHEQVVGPGAPGWDGPAVLGKLRATASRLVAGANLGPPEQVAGPGWAWFELDGPGWLLLAASADLPGLRSALASAGSPSVPARAATRGRIEGRR